MYDAGALVFKLQTLGAQLFKQDQADAEKALEKTGKAASNAAGQVDGLGTSTDKTSKKAKESKAPLDEQAKSTKKTGDESEQASKKQEQQRQATEGQIEAAKKLSAALTVAGVAVAALVGLSVAKSADFDAAMSNVRAATMATADEQRQLSEAALDAGADTAYSAREAADAQEELAKAGLSVSEIIGGSLNGALALAAAGQLQVARSAEIMATTLKQFRLEGKDSAHVSDLLAAGAGKAQGSVDDLALALQYVGPVAAGLGISLEETTGTLALFASQGQLGERAGTGLRGVLMSLTSPSQLAAKTMKEYNVEIFDSNGKMKSLADISQQLKIAFGGLTEAERSAALGRIFGNEQITAARVLYEGGADAVKEWTAAVDDSGYAARQAAMRQDNLAGDVEKLGGAFDTALIRTGSVANDTLRGMVQTVTELVDMYGEAPQPIQATAMVLGVATAAVLLFAGGAVGARAKFLELQLALDKTNMSMGKTAIVGGIAGLALTGVLAIVTGLMTAQADARARAESYADALGQTGDAAESAARKIVATNLSTKESFLWLESDSAYDAAKKLGLGIDLVTDAAEGNRDAQAKLREEMEFGGFGSEEFKSKLEDLGLSLTDYQRLSSTVTQAVERETNARDEGLKLIDQQSEATDESTEVSKSAADAYLDEASSVEDLNSQLSELIDQINQANGVNQDAITASIDYQDTLRSVDEQIANIKNGVEGFARGIDEATQAGADNKAMLIAQAKDAWDFAESQLAAGGSTADFSARLEAARQKLYDNAIQMGATEEEAAALRDTILQMPTQREIDIIADTAAAQTAIDTYIYKNSNREIIVKIGTSRVAQGPGGTGGITFADGGVVSYHANGSITENRVAQIARAGEYRVWAEPETGGEGYVPLAPSKRARSEAIMAEIADRFGGIYIPAGAQQFAAGAPAPAPAVQRAAFADGERITLVVEGAPLTAIVRREIGMYDAQEFGVLQRGVRSV